MDEKELESLFGDESMINQHIEREINPEAWLDVYNTDTAEALKAVNNNTLSRKIHRLIKQIIGMV